MPSKSYGNHLLYGQGQEAPENNADAGVGFSTLVSGGFVRLS